MNYNAIAVFEVKGNEKITSRTILCHHENTEFGDDCILVISSTEADRIFALLRRSLDCFTISATDTELFCGNWSMAEDVVSYCRAACGVELLEEKGRHFNHTVLLNRTSITIP